MTLEALYELLEYYKEMVKRVEELIEEKKGNLDIN